MIRKHLIVYINACRLVAPRPIFFYTYSETKFDLFNKSPKVRTNRYDAFFFFSAPGYSYYDNNNLIIKTIDVKQDETRRNRFH